MPHASSAACARPAPSVVNQKYVAFRCGRRGTECEAPRRRRCLAARNPKGWCRLRADLRVARRQRCPASPPPRSLISARKRHQRDRSHLCRGSLAHLTGDKKIEVVPLKEVQPLTGYLRGGVTALAAKREYPVYVDETIELFDVVSISAGMRGAQILIAPADYLRATSAKVGPIGKAP